MLEANTIQFTLSEWSFLLHKCGLFTDVGLYSWLVLNIVILCDVGSCDVKYVPEATIKVA